jgi:hypothetical protein
VVLLCATSALWADVCGGLPTSPVDCNTPTRTCPGRGMEYWPDPKDGLAPLSFQLSVKPGGTALRITVRAIDSDTAQLEDVHAGDIEVTRCQDGKQLQLLPILAEGRAVNFGLSFNAYDINFDGYLDFSVLTGVAASSGRKRSYWVYDPDSGLFLQNKFTEELGKDYLGSIGFDPKKREIHKGYFGAGRGCPGTSETAGDSYRVENNSLKLTHKQEIRIDPGINQDGINQVCTVTVSDLIGGAMRVTRVRRFDASGQPVK